MTQNRTTILYAEDDENDVFFMKRAFAKGRRPEQLVIVRDGQKAVNYVLGRAEFADRSAHPLPGLILLDIKMPQLTGIEALRAFRADAGSQAIPVVLLTSSTQESDIAEAQLLQANGYFVKPSDATELIELLQSLSAIYQSSGGAGSYSSIKGNRLS